MTPDQVGSQPASAPAPEGSFPATAARYLPPALFKRMNEPRVRPAVGFHLEALLQTVSTYLPRTLQSVLLAQSATGQIWGRRGQGTLLFADLSGFTTLSAELGREGLAGAEQLVAIVNAIFTTMLEIIDREGGDLVVFGGDALLALFGEKGHALSALRAARQMQQAMGLFSQIETSSGPFSLAMHVGLNSGDFLSTSVGKPEAMQYALMGRTVEETARAEELAGPGEIVAGAGAVQAISLPVPWQPLEGPWYRLGPGLSLPPGARGKYTLDLANSTGIVAALDTLVPYLPAGLLERLVPYPSEPRVEAELKPVAVLFANLLGFETLLEELGPAQWEQAVGLLQRYVVAIQEIVGRYGGTLNKVDLSTRGIKLLALFGAPTKHEDDPERAVYAALEMQRTMETLGPELAGPARPPLQQRIGLHTGDVFCGNVGSSWRKEYTVMGTTVNLAARLMAAAEPGQVLATAALVDWLGAGCEAEGPREVQVKGWETPLSIYRVSDLHPTVRAGRPRPLVGRQAELSLLTATVQETRVGYGQLILLRGEAGIGKSRLAAETAAIARENGMRVLVGRTPSYGERIPYAPWNEILRACLGWTAEMPAEERASRLREKLQLISPDAEPWAPVLAEALGLALPETELTAGLGPRLRRQRFFDLALQLLQAEASVQPLMLLLEDLHWAGPLFQELLTYLTRNLAQDPVLLLGTSRPTADSFSWAKLPNYQVVEVPGFSTTACREMVTVLTGCRVVDPDLATLIEERTQGNPLFVEEIVEALEEQELLVREGSRLRLQGDPRQARGRIPPTVQGVLLSRIDHLPEGTRRILRLASVIDLEFPFSALVGVSPYQDSEQALRDHVRALCQAGMLDETDPETSTYAFRHVLAREVAYQSIPPSRQRDLHGRVGRQYEKQFADRLEQYYGFLAYHYRHSTDPEKAVEYALKAGRQAAHSYANEAAATYFQQALELDAAEMGLLDPREKVQLRRERGDVLLEAGLFADALAEYEAALKESKELLDDNEIAELYRRCSDVDERRGRYEESLDALQKAYQVLLRLPPEHSRLEMARVLTCMSNDHWHLGAYERAGQLNTEALDIAQDVPPGRERDILLGQIYTRQGNLATTVGQYQDAVHSFEEGLHCYERAGLLPETAIIYNNMGFLWFMQDEYQQALESSLRCLEVSQRIANPYIAAYAAYNLGVAWYALGDYALAMEYLQQSLATRERIGDQAGTASCWETIGLVHTVRGEHQEAIAVHQRSLELSRKLGDSLEEANALINLARDHYFQEAVDLASARIEEALRLLSDLNTDALLPEAHTVAAQVLLAQGRAAEARGHAEIALRTAESLGQRRDRAVATRVLAETLAAEPGVDVAQVESSFLDAIATLSALQCRLELAHARHAYGLFLRSRGRLDEARAELTEARQIAQEIGAEWGDGSDE